MKKTQKSALRKSIMQWVKSVLLIDLVFWVLVGGSCAKDSVSCLETVGFGQYFFYLPFSRIPQPWLALVHQDLLQMILYTLFVVLCHILLGVLLGWIFKKKHFRLALSFVISFAVVVGAAFVFGYIHGQQELAESTATRTIVVTGVEDGMVNYLEVEWYEGEAAIEAAKNDGCIEGCTPNGFYMSINTSNVTGMNVDAFKDTKFTLLRQPDMSPVEVSFEQYLEVRRECKIAPESCEYYGIGAEYEYFDATFNNGGFVSMIEKYVP